MGLVLGIVLAAIGLAVILGIAALVLIKLGVITHYAFKDEPSQTGDFGLDQSREAGEE